MVDIYIYISCVSLFQFFLDTDDTMYVDKYNEKSYDDMNSFCKTKWNGQGYLPHFFSEIEYERLKFYIDHRRRWATYVLPISGGNFRHYQFLLSDDKTKIFNYMPWLSGNPSGSQFNIYVWWNDGLNDYDKESTLIVCQSKTKFIVNNFFLRFRNICLPLFNILVIFTFNERDQ